MSGRRKVAALGARIYGEKVKTPGVRSKCSKTNWRPQKKKGQKSLKKKKGGGAIERGELTCRELDCEALSAYPVGERTQGAICVV